MALAVNREKDIETLLKCQKRALKLMLLKWTQVSMQRLCQACCLSDETAGGESA